MVGSLRGDRGSRLCSRVDFGVLARTPEFASGPSSLVERLGLKLIMFRLSSPLTNPLSRISYRGLAMLKKYY